MSIRDDREPGLEPTGAPDPESAAKQRFVHGVLEFMHKDDAAQRNRRVREAMDRIGAADTARRRRSTRRFVPLATAALIAVAVVMPFLVSPQPSAYALVDAAIATARSAPALRFEILIADRDANGSEENRIGTLDLRGESMLVRIRLAHGDDFVMGRDGVGEWSLRRDGSVERLEPRRAAPRWINLGDETILVDSLVGLLERLSDDFVIERVDDSSSEDGATVQFVATRRAGRDRSGPNRIIVWIEPDTTLVDRLELRWTEPVGPPNRGPGPRGGPSRGGDGVERPGPHDPRGRPPRGPGPPPPPRRPELLGGPPGFAQGHHPPPPRRVIFQRVESVELDDAQFSPPSS